MVVVHAALHGEAAAADCFATKAVDVVVEGRVGAAVTSRREGISAPAIVGLGRGTVMRTYPFS